jgi:hypothetical protein
MECTVVISKQRLLLKVTECLWAFVLYLMAKSHNHQRVQLIELWLKEMYVFFSDELDSGHCDALLKAELKER